MTTPLKPSLQTQIEANVFKHFIRHLQENTDVQNIDLMILADFCRNCLSKWYVAEAEKLGEEVSLEEAHQIIYGMSYGAWKSTHQTPATPEQLKALEDRQKKKK